MSFKISETEALQATHWLHQAHCSVDALKAHTARRTARDQVPLAAGLQHEIPLYDGAALRSIIGTPTAARALMAEWGAVLMQGAGIIVIQNAFDDLAVVDAASAHFSALIAQQQSSGSGGGDHFAKPGANDRIWNALQKHCLRDPDNFARYYGNPLLALACQAWLGPGYQVTAQVNVVNPGGAAQQPHRDYHLGFMTPAQAQAYPAHTHRLSPVLTLQGAIAHCDMPLESGPTLYLPFSQTYELGYLLSDLPAFQEHFEKHHVQLALAKGDMVFFNPAVLHAAGHNRSASTRRMANLLQVSSAMGRAMESLNRSAMAQALYPALAQLLGQRELSAENAAHAVAASAEGYAFPTNLDSDPPIGGLAPPSQQDLMLQALREGWEAARFNAALEAQALRRVA